MKEIITHKHQGNVNGTAKILQNGNYCCLWEKHPFLTEKHFCSWPRLLQIGPSDTTLMHNKKHTAYVANDFVLDNIQHNWENKFNKNPCCLPSWTLESKKKKESDMSVTFE